MFFWRDIKFRIVITILKKNKVGTLKLPDFKNYYKATAIKTGWLMVKEQVVQQNRLKSPEVNIHKYSQLIFDKGTKTIQWRKVVNTISTDGVGTTGLPLENHESRQRLPNINSK